MPQLSLTLTPKGRRQIEEKALDAVADAIFSKSQENIIDFGKVDTGFLLRSGNVERSPGRRKIVYSAPYATGVEFGTPPHTAPYYDILKWVKRKLGITNERAAKAIAANVVRKIEREGTAPSQFMRKAIDFVKYRPRQTIGLFMKGANRNSWKQLKLR
jgi:hypothetical protein